MKSYRWCGVCFKGWFSNEAGTFGVLAAIHANQAAREAGWYSPGAVGAAAVDGGVAWTPLHWDWPRQTASPTGKRPVRATGWKAMIRTAGWQFYDDAKSCHRLLS